MNLVRHYYIGIDDWHKASLLISLASFEELEQNLMAVDSDLFTHHSGGWGGHGDLSDVLKNKQLKLTGRELQLIKPLKYYGSDWDCGHKTDWSINILTLYEAE